MGWDVLLGSLSPAFVYVFCEKKFGHKKAVLAAMVVACIFLSYVLIVLGWDKEIVIPDAVLLLVMSLISYHLSKPIYFKLQPLILNIILALYISYLNYFSQPFFLRYVDMIADSNPEAAAILSQRPELIGDFEQISYIVPVILVVHGIMVAYAAFRMSNVLWLMARLSIYPLTFVTLLVVLLT